MTKRFKNPKQFKSREIHRKKSSIMKKPLIWKIENKLDSPTSSTKSSSNSSRSESVYRKEDETSNLLDKLLNSSEGSCSETDVEDLPQNNLVKSLAEDEDYFVDFTGLPDISSISEDVSLATVEKNETEDATQDIEKLADEFIDLDNEDISRSVSQINVAECLPEESHTTSEEQLDLQFQPAESSDLSLPDYELKADRDDESLGIIADEENNQTQDLFETFLKFDLLKIDDMDEIDFKSIAKEQEVHQLQQQVLKFLNDLVQKVVNKAETQSPDFILRTNLDKRKLLLELLSSCQQLAQEDKMSEQLNRKVLEFYKREKIYRPIIPENTNTLPHEKRKYLESVKRLDKLLTTKENVGDSLLNSIKSLRNEFKATEQQTKNEILVFEDLVKRNLCRENRPQFNFLIEDLLRRMAEYRKELSDVRFKLIAKQHTHAQLTNKVSRIENLGNGVTLKEYDFVRMENQGLGRKVEERDAELKKLHLRLRTTINIFAHLKEQQNIAKNLLENQTKVYKELQNEHSSMRKYMCKLKLRHSQLRKEIEDLSFQNGLMDKPALMYDYDQTVTTLSEKRTTVTILRATLETIRQRIDGLEKRLSKNNTNNNVSLIR